VEAVSDGAAAWERVQVDPGIRILVLDWMMPELDGIELCRRVSAMQTPTRPYVILLTARTGTQDIVAGLEAGAHDYIKKPFDRQELMARIHVGKRVAELESALVARVEELQNAISHIKHLQGILPICMHCHRIRDDHESWQRIETYLMDHADVQLSHGLCPDCFRKHYPQFTDEVDKTS
jgi:DNA-binding response OmpR family regulator